MLQDFFQFIIKRGFKYINFCKSKFLIFTAVIFLLSTNIISQKKSDTENNEAWGVAFQRTMFLNSDYNDAKAAIIVYVQKLQDQLLKGFSMKPVYFEDTEDLLNNYSKENLGVITLSSVDFLTYKTRLSLYPILVNSGKIDPLETYLILTRNNENINGIEALADKKIGMQPKGNDPIPVMWLDVLLESVKRVKTNKLFTKIVTDKTESQLILSLFFGQLDACLVTKTAFETMVEINPQIGRQLKILNSSPGYIRAVSSFTIKFKNSKYSPDLLTHLTRLDNYASGRQLFALTKTAKIIPYKDEYLDNVRALISSYNKLKNHLIK
jgi:phosphonate transport system substrate-binding protein